MYFLLPPHHPVPSWLSPRVRLQISWRDALYIWTRLAKSPPESPTGRGSNTRRTAVHCCLPPNPEAQVAFL